MKPKADRSEYLKRWYLDNREILLAKANAYYATKKFSINTNVEKQREYMKKWRKKQKAKKRRKKWKAEYTREYQRRPEVKQRRVELNKANPEREKRPAEYYREYRRRKKEGLSCDRKAI